MRKLEGYVALITGGPRNIGRAMALAFADAGAHVAVTALSDVAGARAVVEEIEQRGVKGLAVACDVTKEDDVARLRDEVGGAFGRLDALVNNAAVRHETSFGEMTYAQWRHVMGVTLDGAFLTATAMLPLLKASGRGAIVNIGGMSAYTGAKKRVHVLAAKSGLAASRAGSPMISRNTPSPPISFRPASSTPSAAAIPPRSRIITSTMRRCWAGAESRRRSRPW